jgi:transcriptional regulator with XRE-family HTH domain
MRADEPIRRGAQVALGPDVPERDEILRVFGRNVKALRMVARLTQPALSERSFLSCENISTLERGKLTPNLLVLLALSDALGVPLAELVEGVRAPTRQRSRRQIRQLIERHPGISTTGLADTLKLPPWYVRQDARYMSALSEIRGRDANWQPAPQSPSHPAEQR